MNFKKCISWIMAIAMAVTLFSVGTFTAAAAEDVIIKLSTETVMQGQEVVVNINVVGTAAGIEGNIVYDNAALELIGIEALHTMETDNSQPKPPMYPNVGRIFAFNVLTNTTMNGLTWKLTFRAKTTALGAYSIAFTNVYTVLNPGPAAITNAVTNGAITVNALNWTAYDLAIAAKNAVTDETLYTAKSYQNYLAALANFTALNRSDYSTPQATIDAAAAQLDAILSLLVLKTDYVEMEGIEFDKPNLDLDVGDSEKLNPTFKPENASDKALIWTSSDPRVATVDENGVITAVGPGTATITAKTEDGGFEASITVTVKPNVVDVTGIKIVDPPLDMLNEKTKTATLKATVTPSNATNKTVTWASSDTKIATVHKTSGVVTPKGPGTVTITATAGGKSATCKITVHQYVSLRVGYTKAIRNGVKTTIDDVGTKPFKISGKTMLPLRFVGVQMGGTVAYINDNQPITMSYGTKKVEFKLNSKTMTDRKSVV